MKNVVKTYEKRFLTFYFGSYELPQEYIEAYAKKNNTNSFSFF